MTAFPPRTPVGVLRSDSESETPQELLRDTTALVQDLRHARLLDVVSSRKSFFRLDEIFHLALQLELLRRRWRSIRNPETAFRRIRKLLGIKAIHSESDERLLDPVAVAGLEREQVLAELEACQRQRGAMLHNPVHLKQLERKLASVS